MESGRRWTVDVYETQAGDRPAWSFIAGVEGRNRVEAIALVKLLEERGNALRRPHSGALGDGLFELRGKEVRLFYVFRPGRRVVLLDGEIKKRPDVPRRTLSRLRGYQKELAHRAGAAVRRRRER
jgi:hypothetical protein